MPNPQPDSRGVITYATYQVAVAQDGDTLATVASRVGTTTAELAAATPCPRTTSCAPARCCSCPTACRARPGAGLDTGDVTHPAAASSVDRRASTAPRRRANPFQNGQTDPLIDPVRHRVEAGETAYSIARLYGVSVTALASWNGLGPDLAVRENQELLIPIVSDANRISSAPDRHPARPGHAGRARRRAPRRRCPPTSPPRSIPDRPTSARSAPRPAAG